MLIPVTGQKQSFAHESFTGSIAGWVQFFTFDPVFRSAGAMRLKANTIVSLALVKEDGCINRHMELASRLSGGCSPGIPVLSRRLT